MKIYCLKQNALDKLKEDVKENLFKYQCEDQWVDQYFIKKGLPNYFFDSGIEVKDYQLIAGGSETDFQNAVTIYEAFHGKINRIQASDLRLWAYLSHIQHWDYMHTRWEIKKIDPREVGQDSSKIEQAINKINSRYFFGSSRGKAFGRQGIARLYWSADFTYDQNNSNPYEYTEYFFKEQDIMSSIIDRSYARNKTLVLAMLNELKENPNISRSERRSFLAKLNQSGSIAVFDFLNKNQAEELCKKIMNSVVG